MPYAAEAVQHMIDVTLYAYGISLQVSLLTGGALLQGLSCGGNIV